MDNTVMTKLQPLALYADRGLSLVRGKGMHLYDAHGREYLDMMSNYGVAILGHAHPEVTEAIAQQAAQLTTAHQSFSTPARDTFLEVLGSLLPESLSRCSFSNSGAESIEAALKFARAVTGRIETIAFDHGYHGRTFGALALTADTKYRQPFEPMFPGVTHVPYGDIDAVKAALNERIAAVIIEPIQGEAGVHVVPPGFLNALRELCTANGTLLIFDEIQTAFRTGHVFAFEHEVPSVVPDILCLSKGIANGLPMGVTVTTETVGEKVPKGSHGSTFAGNPLVCAAGAATLRVVGKPEFQRHVESIGHTLIERLRAIEDPLIREVRGCGLMIAVELRRPAGPVMRLMQEDGVLVLPAGTTSMRMLPPLLLNEKHVEQAAVSLEKALVGVRSKR